MSRPDIFISSYVTNDAQCEDNYEQLQDFERCILRDEQCDKPLLIHFDSILGLPSQKILEANYLSQQAHTMGY